MPRLLACADCGTKVYSGPGSLGEGKTICRACRRKRRPRVEVQEHVPVVLDCPTCAATFIQGRATQVYCQPACRPGRRATKPKAPAAMRGYGAEHRALRREWKPKVEAGLVDCARCGVRIQPGQAWDLGHTDDRTGYNGPECRTCNRSHGARKRHELGAPAATDHLKWDWQDCADCGARCYGKRCNACYRASQRARPLAAKPKRSVSTVRFGTCERCGAMFAARTTARRFCSERCMRGLPEHHACADCQAIIPVSRTKCDDCVVASKRAKKRRERRAAASRRRATTGGAGSSRTAHL